MWDMRKSYSRYNKSPLPTSQFRHPGNTSKQGFTALTIDSGGRYLYASCMDNKIYQYSLGNFEETFSRQFGGYENSSFYIKIALSPDNRYLVSGSSDKKAYLWNVEENVSNNEEIAPLGYLDGHSAEVTCVAWCDVNWRLVTCADDMHHFIWEPNRSNDDNVEGKAVMSRKLNYTLPTRMCVRNNFVQASPVLKDFTKDRIGNDNTKSKPSQTTKTGSKQKSTLAHGSPSISSFFGKHSLKRSQDDDTLNSPNKRRRPLTPTVDNNSNTSPPMHMNSMVRNLPCSPQKMNVTPKKTSRPSPRKLVNISPQKLTVLATPTANLPNLVRDGIPEKPKNVTPKASSKNWLTVLSDQKKKENRTSPSNLSPRGRKSARKKIFVKRK